ncbi:helicase HerA-like domain-containing protein [Hwanghaeella sp.]|uniref:helicase HerA-like domain-containing protein n=1 Tax=Hwanghaeella sp. TaxID=2605943 RepID=UPI003CCBFCC1
MIKEGKIYLGKGGTDLFLSLKYANRHGLVAGATGTGKTVTLRDLAEGFSAAGVPVFAADIKGDLSGLSVAETGEGKPFLIKRAEEIGWADKYQFQGFPTVYWDLFGRQGHPVRTTISEMGPVLLSRLLNLNDTQEGVLTAVFEIADDEGMLLLDLKDLRAMLTFVGDNARQFRTAYGNIAASSVGAIQRRILTLENQGGENIFGEPALELSDFMRVEDGKGIINLLAADELMQSPKLYATFLLWLLSELFEELPEVGDPDKPKLVFFFDEAHLLFSNAPSALLEKITQVVRLIRSKGVGVYFVTQNPADIPDAVLGQLGNRIQHALRAYTPKERKAIRAAAESFRENPAFDTEQVITELGVGEALVSTLQEKGIPGIVERTLIRPPCSQLDPLTDRERDRALSRSPLAGKYDKRLDRESAYEMLEERARVVAEEERRREEQAARELEEERRHRENERARKKSRTARRSSRSDSLFETAAKSVIRTVGSELGRRLIRGVLGSLLR